MHTDLLVRLELARRRGHAGPARPVRAWDDSVWQQLRQRPALDAFMRQGRATSTESTYAAQQCQFGDFCCMLGVGYQQPFTADLVCKWVMGRAANGYKLSTIELGLYAVNDLLEEGKLLADPLVARALRAAARRPSAVRRSKVPILLPLLQQLVPHAASYWREARDFAFWVLAWHGLFRGAEMVQLCWEHIHLHARGLSVLVTASKTDQAGAGQHVFLHAADNDFICPVKVLQRLASFVHDLNGPIFTVHQHVLQPVSKATMRARLGRSLADLGQCKALYGLHSFRSGGATAAAMGGVPERLIKAHGRWVLDVVRVYLYSLPEELWQVSAAMH